MDNNYEWVQTVGEIASFAPGVGAAVNIANGGLDIKEGHYLSGGLQAVGGVFELGSIAKVGVVTAKAEVAAEQMSVRTAETVAEEAGTASRNATNAVAEESGAASKGCINGTCFVAGTLVTMADGSLRPIGQIREGDRVLSKDEVSGKVEAKKVTHAFAKHTTLVVSLHLSNGETLEATGDHPFYVQGKGWTPARECGVGTSIVTRAGPSVQVKSVDRHERDETVFNLTVEDDHSFFVGKAGAWTHNTGECPYPVYYEMQLNQADFRGSDSVHFGRANAALEGQLAREPRLLEELARFSGDSQAEVLSSVASAGGRENVSKFTWHHALREQASGRDGVMQLVLTRHHVKFGRRVYHPNRIGGYEQWAIPAGAPRRR